MNELEQLKQELDNRLKQLYCYIDKEIEKVKSKQEVISGRAIFKPSQDIIRVPECIKIVKYDLYDGDNLGIVFNNNKQVLSYRHYNGGIYDIRCHDSYKQEIIPCQLIKYNRGDLKPGDTAFRTNSENPKFNDLLFYCKIINDEEFTYISDKNIMQKKAYNYKFWYKVTPVK